ncbi:MAG TPA: HD domain-containing protein [Pyrodictium sp.]|nr:HD domain-containing protein [Pyrodictium sp.]
MIAIAGLSDEMRGLLACVLEAIDHEEERFSGTRTLRGHSLLVAYYASTIAARLGLDPVVYYLAGLLHDYGKLEARAQDLDEEDYTVKAAKELLEKLGAPRQLAEAVAGVLSRGTIGDPVLGDADVLSKLGLRGLAEFVAKWTARGSDLPGMLVEGLPRELTVARNVDQYLCTAAAKGLAQPLARETLEVYRRLLEEAEEALGLGLRLVEENIEGVTAVFVTLERCPHCLREGLEKRLEPRRGRVCQGYRLVHRCPSCGWAASGGVCLPRRQCSGRGGSRSLCPDCQD